MRRAIDEVECQTIQRKERKGSVSTFDRVASQPRVPAGSLQRGRQHVPFSPRHGDSLDGHDGGRHRVGFEIHCCADERVSHGLATSGEDEAGGIEMGCVHQPCLQ